MPVTNTLGNLIQAHDFSVLSHLDLDFEIPVNAGLQAQGDLFIVPAASAGKRGAEVPAEGIAVIEAVGSGHEHRLFASVPGTAFFQATRGFSRLEIGVLECEEAAYLLHPEHGATGIAPGTYILRRQREQATEERIVAD